MKRLLPFVIVVTTAVAALLIIIVQPQQTTLQKKRLKDMRQFLLAQTDPPPFPPPFDFHNCDAYMRQDPLYYYSACEGWRSNSSRDPLSDADRSDSLRDRNDLNAVRQQRLESECLAVFDQSSFGAVRGRYGLPNTTRTIVHQICLLAENARVGKQGSFDLDVANRAILTERDFALINTPGFENQTMENYITNTVNPYLKDILGVMEKFSMVTATHAYLINPLPYIIGRNGLHEKLVALIEKYIIKSEAPVAEKLPAPDTNKVAEISLPAVGIPVASAAPKNSIIRAVNAFIKILKESILNIRERGPKRRAAQNTQSKNYFQETKELIRYFHKLRQKN